MIVAHAFIPYKGRKKQKPVMPLFPGNDLPGATVDEGCGCSKCATEDGSGASILGELEAHGKNDDWLDLIERLTRAIEISRTKDALRAWMTGDEEEGHAFHGNQYTGSLGAKPTETKVTGVKSGVHELLSSGHSFSMEELQKATGAKTVKQISDALAMLKNPKWAGSKGVLKIEKKGNEYYVANAAGAPVAAEAPAPAAAQPLPEVPALAEAKGPEKSPMSAPYTDPATPPADGPLTKEHADVVYKAHMDEVLAHVKSNPFENHAAVDFKNGKAKAMAQWKANTTGATVTPKKQEVYEADKHLVEDLKSGKSNDEALANWKTNTAKEKAGTWPPSKVAAKQAALAEQQKKEAAAASSKPAPVVPPTLQASTTAHAPHFEPVTDYVPEDHAPISGADFADGTFGKNISKLKSALHDGHTDAVGNKVSIQAALTARLKDAKAFQEVAGFFKKKGGNYGGSLEATLISTWASTSADSHPVSICNQIAVREAFGMDADDVAVGAASSHLKSDDDAIHHQAANQLGYPIHSPAQMATFKAALQDFALAQWHNTQEHLKAKGIEHVYVARGMKTTAGLTSNAEVDTVRMQPVSSFSANLGTARSFAAHGGVYFVKVPRTQVLSSYVTGFGCTNEHEVCVLAHPGMTAVKMQAHNAGSMQEVEAHVNKTLQSMSPEAKAMHEAGKAKKAAAAAKKAAKTSHWWKPPPKPTGAKTGGYASAALKAAKANNLAGVQDIVEKIKAHNPAQWEKAIANPAGSTYSYVKYLQQGLETHQQSAAYKAGPAKYEPPKAPTAAETAHAKAVKEYMEAGDPGKKPPEKTKYLPPPDAAQGTAIVAHKAAEAGNLQGVELALTEAEHYNMSAVTVGYIKDLKQQVQKQLSLGPASNPGTFPSAPAFGNVKTWKVPAHIESHPHYNAAQYQEWTKAGLTDFQVGKKLAMAKFKAKQKALAEHVLGA